MSIHQVCSLTKHLCLSPVVTLTPGITDGRSSVDALLRELPNPDVMPLPQEGSGPLEVNISLNLVQINDMHRYSKDIGLQVHLSMQWASPELSLNENEYWLNNTDLVLPTKHLWLPDITYYNTVSRPDVRSPDVATLYSDGSVFFAQLLTQRVICESGREQVGYVVVCTLSFSSWAHNNKTLSLTTREQRIDFEDNIMNQRHEIFYTSVTKQTKEFPCCPGVGLDEIVFTVVFRYI